MKVLVVGGTGLVGAWISVALKEAGHDVVIFARQRPKADSPVREFPYVQGNYFSDDISPEVFDGVDALVFSACSDIRHMPPGQSTDEFFQAANVEGVPRFIERAKTAGVQQAVYIGTLYASLLPEAAKSDPYVRSRMAVDEAVRSMASPNFRVVTIDIPYAVGAMPGLIPNVFKPIAEWALGRSPHIPLVAPAGGSNFMSLRSIAQTVERVLEGSGENGRAYLIGDENISFREFCRMFFRAAGREEELPVTAAEHPLLPDAMLPAGRGGWLRFDPEAAQLFRYTRDDVEDSVRQVVDQTRLSS